VQHLALQLSNQRGWPLYRWSQSTGLARLSRTGEPTFEPGRSSDALDILKHIQGTRGAGVWLLEDYHPFLEGLEAHAVVRWIRELARLGSMDKLVLLSTPREGLPLDLRKEVPTLEIPLPDADVLADALEDARLATGISTWRKCDELIDAARGLTVMEARLAYGRAAAELQRLDETAAPSVAREKERIIRESQVLEHVRVTSEMTDVGGLDALKDWLERRGKAFGPSARKFGLDAPKGVLLLGVQGCGKSLCAKAVATSWRLPLLRLDVGRVFGGIVGQSESNIREALRITQALAPCVLWLDEIEKSIAGLGSSDRSDGGTTARVVGALLTWLQEKRDPVFVVATANRVDLLPPELLRKGRFDEIFFVDLPEEAARLDILEIHLRRKGRSPSSFDVALLASEAEGFSGAEIEEAVREGMFQAFAAGEELTTHHIARAIAETYPLSRTMPEELDRLRRWSVHRARSATTLPVAPVGPRSRLSGARGSS